MPAAEREQGAKDDADMPPKTGVAEWIRANSNIVMAVFTGVIALATIVQVCIYSAQLDEMRVDQRAWLAVKFIPFSGPVVGSTVPAPLFVVNVGKTVAKDIRGWIFFRPVPIGTAIDLGEYKKVESSSLPTGEPIPAWSKFQTGVIFPGDPVFMLQAGIARTPVGRSTPEATIWDGPLQEQWVRGDVYLALHGKFTYTDAAGNPHWTTFCSTFVAPGSGKNVSSDTSDRCVSYNTVDNNK